jgi:general secretion pathway protein A
MYKSLYKIDSKPFELRPDPAFLWLGEKYKEVLSTLRYGILQNKGFLLLTGSGGMGKTTLINSLVEGLAEDVECAVIADPRMERVDFYNEIAEGFGMNTLFSSKVQFLIQFSHFLHKAHDDGKKVLLLIDDCHLLSQEMLEELRLLSNIEKAEAKLINIFFIGEPQFNEMLIRQRNRAVRQRLTLNAKLMPLNVNETGDYIQHRLCVAGGAEKLFTAKAVQLIHKHSQGVPRFINVLCEYALQAGSSMGRKNIDHKLIKECVQRLDLTIKAASGDANFETLGEKNGCGDSLRDRFVIEKNNGLPTMSGFSVENGGRKRIWLIILPLLFFAGSSLYYFYPRNNIAHTVVKEKNPVQPVVVKEPLVKVTSSPAASVLENSDAEINEKKAAALKNVILSKAYSEEAVQANQEIEETQVIDAVADSVETAIIEDSDPFAQPDEPSIQPEEPVGQHELIGAVEEGNEAVKGQMVEEQLEHRGSVKRNMPDIPPMEPVKIILPLRPNSLQLTRQAKREFDRFVKKLRRYPEAQIVVRGYVSSNADSPENRQLSEKRAEAVGRLMMQYGIDREQLEIKGMGIRNPIASNKTGAGRRKNRRVEIEVLSDGR